jgi:predicted AlkP superfamily phosphohydrolase/phosphomutase
MIKQIPRKQIRMKQLMLLVVSVFSMFLISCASSKSTTTIANGSDLSKYKYVVFGNGDEGEAELSDILMLVQNDISQRLKVVTPENASNLIREGKGVLSPKISVKTEKWDGGHTYITISFYDYSTNQSVAVVKSSGIGLTISHDQKLAYKALKKELDKTFK